MAGFGSAKFKSFQTGLPSFFACKSHKAQSIAFLQHHVLKLFVIFHYLLVEVQIISLDTLSILSPYLL